MSAGVVTRLLSAVLGRRQSAVPSAGAAPVVVWRRCALVADVYGPPAGAVKDECSTCGRHVWYTLTQPALPAERIMCTDCADIGRALRSALGHPLTQGSGI